MERQVQTWHELCNQDRWGFSTGYYSVPKARTWVPWPTFWSHCMHCRMFSCSPHTCCNHRNCLETGLVSPEAESSPRRTLPLSPHSWSQHSTQPPRHTCKDLMPTPWLEAPSPTGPQSSLRPSHQLLCWCCGFL